MSWDEWRDENGVHVSKLKKIKAREKENKSKDDAIKILAEKGYVFQEVNFYTWNILKNDKLYAIYYPSSGKAVFANNRQKGYSYYSLMTFAKRI